MHDPPVFVGPPADLRERLEALAADLGHLRGLEIAGVDWRVERCCVAVEELLLSLEPTASDLVKDGLPVESALRYVDACTLRIRRLLGADERDLRLAGLID